MSGIGSQLGIAAETDYGDPETVSSFLEFDSFELGLEANHTESTGLRSDTVVPSIGRHRETTRHATGGLQFKVPNQGFGQFLDALHNAAVAPAQVDSSDAYRQVHPIGLTKPRKSSTIQVGKEGADGTVVAYTYPGVVIGQLELSMEQGGDLMCSVEATARDEVTDVALAAAAYPEDIRSFVAAGKSPIGTELSIGGSPIAAVVQSYTLTVPVPYAAERFGIRRSPLKSRPIVNDYVRPTVSVTLEFEDLDVRDLWRADEPLELVIDVRGDQIGEDDSPGDPIYEGLVLTQQIKITQAPVPISGPDLLTQEVTAEIYYDGSAPPVEAVYTSLDSAL